MSIRLENLASHLLVAVPSLNEGPFARSVSLICQHDEHGALGMVINQPTEFTLGEVFAHMNMVPQDENLRAMPVLNGGPLHPERGFVIHDDPRPWLASKTISEELFVTTSRDILRAMANGDGPDNALIVLGCAGWAAGQLENELAQNLWLTVPADADFLFATPFDERWLGAAACIGVDMSHLTSYSGHA